MNQLILDQQQSHRNETPLDPKTMNPELSQGLVFQSNLMYQFVRPTKTIGRNESLRNSRFKLKETE